MEKRTSRFRKNARIFHRDKTGDSTANHDVRSGESCLALKLLASGIIKPYWAFSEIDRHSLNALYNWGLIEKRVNGAVLNSAGSDGLFFPNGKHGFQIRLTPKGMAARENCFFLKASTFNHARKLAGKRFLKKIHHNRTERNVYEFEDYYFEHDDEAR